MPLLKSVVPVNGFQGVANSGSGVLNLGNGYRLHQIGVFGTVAGALADVTTIISRFRLKLGSVTLRDMTATQAINYAKLYGVTPVTGELPIYMTRPWLKFSRQAEATSWDLYGQPANLTLEADFANPGGGAVGIQSTDIVKDSGRNVTRAANGQQSSFLRVVKMKSETAAASGATTVSIVTLDKTYPIKALLFDMSANNITEVEILVNSQQVWKATKTRANALLARSGLAGSNFAYAYVADFMHEDGALVVGAGGTLEVKVTTDGAATITILNVQEAPAFQ